MRQFLVCAEFYVDAEDIGGVNEIVTARLGKHWNGKTSSFALENHLHWNKVSINGAEKEKRGLSEVWVLKAEGISA